MNNSVFDYIAKTAENKIQETRREGRRRNWNREEKGEEDVWDDVWRERRLKIEKEILEEVGSKGD